MTQLTFAEQFNDALPRERPLLLLDLMSSAPDSFGVILEVASARWIDLDAFLLAIQLAVRENPANIPALRALAWHQIRSGEYAEAKDTLTKLITAWPDQADFRRELLRVEMMSPSDDPQPVMELGGRSLGHPMTRAAYEVQLELSRNGEISKERLTALNSAIDSAFADIARTSLTEDSTIDMNPTAASAGIARVMAARTVALVGNGPSMNGLSGGEAIEGHDLVIRCNFPKISGHEADVGSRTDVMVFNESLFGSLKNRLGREHAFANTPLISLHPDAVKVTNFDEICSEAGVEVWRLPLSVRNFFQRFAYSRPTTGMMTAIVLVALLRKKTTLFGFDFFKEPKTHYFGADGQTFIGHELQYEAWFIQEFLMRVFPGILSISSAAAE